MIRGCSRKQSDLHAWNERYAGALHTLLGFVEIALRNAIDGALIDYLGDSEWSGRTGRRGPIEQAGGLSEEAETSSRDVPELLYSLIRNDLKTARQRALRAARSRQVREPHRSDNYFSHEDVLSQLTFGTWVKIIGKPVTRQSTIVTQRLWREVTSHAFPEISDGEDGRKLTARRLNVLHEVRNREAHHENLLYLDTRVVINTSMAVLASLDSRFVSGWVDLRLLREVSHQDPRRRATG